MFLTIGNLGENFFNSGQIFNFLLGVNHEVLCTPLSHSNVCRDSVPNAVFPLFSHQDPARTCYSLSMGQRRRGEEKKAREANINMVFLYTGDAIKAVQEHFSESFYPD